MGDKSAQTNLAMLLRDNVMDEEGEGSGAWTSLLLDAVGGSEDDDSYGPALVELYAHALRESGEEGSEARMWRERGEVKGMGRALAAELELWASERAGQGEKEELLHVPHDEL
jgi:hypothetical protein